ANSTLQRCTTGVLRQESNAFWAASTAARTSSGVQKGTSATASPVAGLRRTSVRPREARRSAPMNVGQTGSSAATCVVVAIASPFLLLRRDTYTEAALILSGNYFTPRELLERGNLQ